MPAWKSLLINPLVWLVLLGLLVVLLILLFDTSADTSNGYNLF